MYFSFMYSSVYEVQSREMEKTINKEFLPTHVAIYGNPIWLVNTTLSAGFLPEGKMGKKNYPKIFWRYAYKCTLKLLLQST